MVEKESFSLDLSDLKEDSKLVAFQFRQKSIVPSHHINLHWSRNPPQPPPPPYQDMGSRRQLHWREFTAALPWW